MTIVQIKIGNKTVQFTLDTKSGVPFYRQIIQQIEYSISSGALEPGNKLPTVRALAIELKVNPNTVAKAYSELEIRGLVTTQVGAGTFVSEKKVDMSEVEKLEKLDALCADLLTKASQLGYSKDDMIKHLKSYGE